MSGLAPGAIAWKTAFEIAPIMLVNGLASFMPFGMLPMAAITEAINLPAGLLSGTTTTSLDSFFAHFKPLPGGTLVDQDLARMPFANQAIAANATIAQPLVISMQMDCPAQPPLGMFLKLGIMEAIQFALTQHNSQGGTYHVATPSFIYFDCVMRTIRDVTSPNSSQPQQTWQIDFEKPLLTLGDAQQALNQLFQKVTNGSKILEPAWSGLQSSVGQAIGAGVGGVVPSASGSVVGSTIPSVGAAVNP